MCGAGRTDGPGRCHRRRREEAAEQGAFARTDARALSPNPTCSYIHLNDRKQSHQEAVACFVVEMFPTLRTECRAPFDDFNLYGTLVRPIPCCYPNHARQVFRSSHWEVPVTDFLTFGVRLSGQKFAKSQNITPRKETLEFSVQIHSAGKNRVPTVLDVSRE